MAAKIEKQKGEFFDLWDYAWRVKKTLKAKSFVIKQADKKFKSGRDKYICYFMGIDNFGMECIISKHDALLQNNKTSGEPYYVVTKKGMEVDTNEAINISNDIQNETLTLMR